MVITNIEIFRLGRFSVFFLNSRCKSNSTLYKSFNSVEEWRKLTLTIILFERSKINPINLHSQRREVKWPTSQSNFISTANLTLTLNTDNVQLQKISKNIKRVTLKANLHAKEIPKRIPLPIMRRLALPNAKQVENIETRR